ncbi:hypothetical protein PILCRDRAFT_65068 [Piloderma croceum F 1598]|uniref:Major facilitator superfamily (MFS) profile domain-containing protein n=1 Tax=Piloderma croceum (strain F 1598) TaxID=765440 RepID=A0A0C3C956_PILCF|nr:hypothetical protein PILCRDRAFT_65068 [Piloderma croceum F 1598]
MPPQESNLTIKPPAGDAVAVRLPKGPRFWLMLLALCMALFLSALEFTAVATALPTITADLHGTDFVWVGSAYALASSAILPMTGGLAQIFGRRPAFLGSIILFTIGSAVCGAAKTMGMLIVGRTIQGLGGGGILSFTTIIISDLVSLEERGLYAGGFYGFTWSIAAAIGPVVGGSLANMGQWRWLFYLNIPLCGLSGGLAVILLNLPTPAGTWRDKLSRMDWIGNFMVIAATCSITIALTFGGINFPWSSAHILAPLIIGLVGLITFIIYEAIWATHPLVPFSLLSNRSSFSGQVLVLWKKKYTITRHAYLDFIPVYFQACKDADAISAGVRTLGLASIAVTGLIGGVSVKIFKRYRPQIWISWALQIVGGGLMTTVKSDTSTAATVGFSVLYGVGAGINYAVIVYPVQAPLPIKQAAPALAFFSFLRSFAGVWGVTLGGAILQNELLRRLPEEFLTQHSQDVALAYSVIPLIRDLPQPLKQDVQVAFAESLRVVWKAVVGVSAAGLVSSFLMRGLPLHTATDKAWDPSKAVEKR